MRVTSGRAMICVCLAAIATALAPAPSTGAPDARRLRVGVEAQGQHDAAPTPAAPAAAAPADGQEPTIEHISPRRDSSGPIPKRLEWTPVKGADSYSVGVWSEADYVVWKLGNLKTTAVDWPVDIIVEPGTYFWSVMAFRGDRPIADSGRAAFIVVR